MRVPSLLRAAVAGLALAATVAIAQPVTAAPGDGAPMRAMRVPAGQRLVRLCFAKNAATLDAAIERLQKI